MNLFFLSSFRGTILARLDLDPDLDPLTLLNPDPIRIRTPENMNFFIYRAFFRNRLSPPDPDPDLDPLTLLNPDRFRIRTPALQKTLKNMNFLFSLSLFGEHFSGIRLH
jgi:hypothetical protein